MGEIAAISAKLLAEMLEGLVVKLAEALSKPMAAAAERLVAFVVALEAIATEISQNKIYGVFSQAVVKFAARAFLDDPRQVATAQKLGLQIAREVATSTAIIQWTFFGCIGVLAAAVGLPLLYRLLFRRNLRIFISFNQMRSEIADQLHSFLVKCRFHVLHLPFDPEAKHQPTLQTVRSYLKQSELTVCIPGPHNSFVEHEIFGASLINRPVLLLVSENDGTIPDTTDKQYPVFQMENVAAQSFQPLEAFIRLIGGDLKSLWDMSMRACRHGFVFRLSQGVLFGMLAVLFALWAYCFVTVVNAPTAVEAISTNPAEARVAIGVHVSFMGFCASVVALCLAYCVRVAWSQFRQWSAQRIAQLKVNAAEFRRDDWIVLMNELPGGDAIYRAMFEAAPLAHYEKLRSAAPA